jgi:predicted CxxxxCH...CXXCH cytochrome family protein
MPSIRVALLAAAVSATLAACAESRQVEGEQAASDCVSCHGDPPTGLVTTELPGAPQVEHPNNGECWACHNATVDKSKQLIDGGAHLNGISGDIRIGPGAACNQCHGEPPPPGFFGRPGTNHPNAQECWTCHGTSVTSTNEVIPVEEGGTHYNGTVEQSGGHPAGYANPAVHGPDALAGITTCQECHGATYAGGVGPSCTACHGTAGFADWQTNCTFCHGAKTPDWTSAQLSRAAPPEGVSGQTDRADRAVGAHQQHLAGVSTLSAGFACIECHPAVSDLGHIDPAPAEIVFGARATTADAAPVYTAGASPTCSSTYCHGAFTGGASATATWTSVAPLTCTSCHGSPPATGIHEAHVNGDLTVPIPCATCHVGYTASSVDAALHVNGDGEAIVQPVGGGQPVRIDGWNCTACHTALGVGG